MCIQSVCQFMNQSSTLNNLLLKFLLFQSDQITLLRHFSKLIQKTIESQVQFNLHITNQQQIKIAHYFNCLSKYNKPLSKDLQTLSITKLKSNNYKMRIQTFQKIQSKLFYVTLLPIAAFIALAIFFSQTLWEEYFLLTGMAFFASIAACLYLVSVNILEKPLPFLIKMYKDSKELLIMIDRKYKTVHELKIQEGIEKKKELNPEETLSEQDFRIHTSQMLGKKDSQRQSMHIAFDVDGERENQKNLQQRPTDAQQQQPAKQLFQPRRILSRASLQEYPMLKPTPTPSSNDIFNLYTFTNQKFQPQKPQRKALSPQKQDYSYFDEFDEDEEAQKLKRHLEKVVGSQEDIEEYMLRDYEERYGKYKKSLGEFSINKEIMEKFVSETKTVLKEKINQHLKKQFENLDSIESILRKNFNASFKSYKDRSNQSTARSVYGFEAIQGYGARTHTGYQDRSPFNKKETFGYQNLGKEIKFSEVLQECINLLQTNYFEFDYIGEEGKINDAKTELKVLVRERIQLDKFLLLKRQLDVGKNSSKSVKSEEKGNVGEFEEERYMVLLKLQTLANILTQRQSAQQNLLKEFFSRHHSYSTEQVEQINDQRNIDIVMNFFVRVLRQKLIESGNDDLIRIQLSRPNFQDRLANMIWVKKEASAKSHYDVVYSLKRDQQQNVPKEKPQTTKSKSQDQAKQPHATSLHCCPGESNIWTCMAFVRLLISRIGLKKEDYPMIKDKELRKDFKRLFQLMK